LSAERIDLGFPPASLVGVRVLAGANGKGLDQALEHLLCEARAEGAVLERGRSAGALAAAAERLDAHRAEAAEELAQTAVDLALEIARHLVAVEVESGRHDIERIVRESLAASGAGRGECTVHLHPSDAATLAGTVFRSGTRIEADQGVARGEVQVETPNGLLVRNLPDALDEIGRRLLGSLRTTR
jgi:flagellar biosynthesis/type III secretory pathway protein FliH